MNPDKASNVSAKPKKTKFNSLGLLTLIGLAITVVNCSSRPVVPEQIEVEVSRSSPDPDCQPLGKVVGRTGSAKEGSEEALVDLKQETVSKGGNFVEIKRYSDSRTAVIGLAYWCP